MIENNKPKGYVDPDYLSTSGNMLKKIKQRSYELMRIYHGQNVLDVGCGPGTDTIHLGAFVGRSGTVNGVDYDMAMVNEANIRADEAGISAYVTHKQGQATELPFNDNYFDSCRSERLFQHLTDPAKALSEMVRVTKPGNCIVVLDSDWGSLSIDTDETDIERRLTRFLAESSLQNGYSGRKLYRLFKQQNLADISVEVMTISTTNYSLAMNLTHFYDVEMEARKAGIITDSELNRWRSILEKADNENTFFSSVNIVIATGIKS